MSVSKTKTKAPKQEAHVFETIASVISDFSDRFGVPRQPGLAPAARAILKFKKDARLTAALKNLDEFTHLWVIFVFHMRGSKDWKPGVRPPRLGGSKKVGVLSSRSPHRPNPIGISVVKMEAVRPLASGGAEIEVSGHDFVDGTPILDVKPYLPYADSIPDAGLGWAKAEIQKYPVEWSEDLTLPLALRARAEEVISLDPRPAFQKRKYPVGAAESVGRKFGIWVEDYDVRFVIESSGFRIVEVERGDPKTKRKKS